MKTNCCKAPSNKMIKILSIIFTAVMSALLVAGIIVCAVLGFNNSHKDAKAVTVTVDTYAYNVNAQNIEATTNVVFAKRGLEVEDRQFATMGSTEVEIVYVFDNDTSLAVLNEAKADLDSGLEDAFPNAVFSVRVEAMRVMDTTPESYVGRGLIAVAIFAALSFLYVWIRYKLFAALYALCGNVFAGGLTTALIALTRIPVTPAVGAAIAASVLFSTVTVLFFFNKLRAAEKEDSAADKSEKEIVYSSIAWKETLLFAGLLGAAFIVMICVGKTAIAWFSLSAIVAVLAATFVGLLLVPTTFVPAKKCADKLAAQKASGYKGAKKGEKAQKSNDGLVD